MVERFIATLAVFLAGLVAATASACAHPHVWVTMHSELVYAPDGSVTGVRDAWTFDDMFSAFATMGFQPRQTGHSRAKTLQPLAKVNVESLKDFDYFTYAKVDGKRKGRVREPTDYWLDYDPKETRADAALHAAVQDAGEGEDRCRSKSTIRRSSSILAMAEDNPVALVGAPAQCKVDWRKASRRSIFRPRCGSISNSLPPRPTSAWARASPTRSR